MSFSMKNVDPAFQGAGQKAGIEIWRIENSKPVPVAESSYGKFYTRDTYIVLKSNATKSGGFRYDIHYWLGKDTSQDEAGTAAIKTGELDGVLGGRSVQYRELQGHETDMFLSYFKPCIMPREREFEEHKNRMFICRGKHVVHIKEASPSFVPCARSSLSHDDIFILDGKNKIFQFNGYNTSIQDRARALEVVQYIKDNYHLGKCDIAAIEDGQLMADAEAGEFWGFFGGFAPLPRKTNANAAAKSTHAVPTQLFCVKKGKAEHVDAKSLTKKLLDTHYCYLLDCGGILYVWVGRNTSVKDRTAASGAAEEYLAAQDRATSNIICMVENFETVSFRSKFDSWPRSADDASEDGRGKVAALLKRRGLDVKGLLKSVPTQEEEEPQPYIDCSGNLQVWRVNGKEKDLLPDDDQSKFYTGDCFIFQYTYTGVDQEECLIGTWFGKQSVEEERDSAISQANKMVESFKFLATQAFIYEGSEPFLFCAIFQSFMVLKGGLSSGYKKYISEKGLPDDTYSADGVALFRVQGTGPDNMQAIQVDPVPISLNSSYCYILHQDSLIFTWNGSRTTAEDQELAERQLDLIKPNMQTRVHKENTESEQFWEILGGRTRAERATEKLPKVVEHEPHLFTCTLSKGDLKVSEIYNFNQNDLLAEDVYIIDCHSSIFLWVGQQVDSKTKTQALAIGKKFLELDALLEKLSLETPLFIIMEGSEPPFFTRFFKWDSTKAAMHGNSFQRRLSLIKDGGRSTMNLNVKYKGEPAFERPYALPGFSPLYNQEIRNQKREHLSHLEEDLALKNHSVQGVYLSALTGLVQGGDLQPLMHLLPSLTIQVEGTCQRPHQLSKSFIQKLVKAKVVGGGGGGGSGAGGRPDFSKIISKSKAIATLTANFDKPTREKLMPRSLKGNIGFIILNYSKTSFRKRYLCLQN
ncbi:hypothetical protein OSB04_012528 [Centaurea solstitialis]|uniref:Gelsolin-like domain-containing protein n=1 Tax=Centaurea solstitialis TaxID=347529 RepID=A0AA38WQ27_9ASTR|nr:hypothetical protein OSB04_012528 [Centaurea solstitialis]